MPVSARRSTGPHRSSSAAGAGGPAAVRAAGARSPTNACTSSGVIRPPDPVPRMRTRSTFSSRARRRAAGPAATSPSEVAVSFGRGSVALSGLAAFAARLRSGLRAAVLLLRLLLLPLPLRRPRPSPSPGAAARARRCPHRPRPALGLLVRRPLSGRPPGVWTMPGQYCAPARPAPCPSSSDSSPVPAEEAPPRRPCRLLLGFAAVTRRAAGLDRQHLLAHPDRVALLDVDAAHRPRLRRGQLERGLVGLQLEQRLVRGHGVALAGRAPSAPRPL